jgi:hypothetical protein
VRATRRETLVWALDLYRRGDTIKQTLQAGSETSASGARR